MDIKFFDDPLEQPGGREEVRIKQIGLHVYQDLRRMMFGVELTPFRERPSLEVNLHNGQGAPAGTLHVIETLTPNFSLTIHLRDAETTNPYTLDATIFYSEPEQAGREVIERREVTFEITQPGEMLFKFEE